MRGHRSVFQSLFPTEAPSLIAVAERKGRNEMLILQRNELLISRYYYYVKLQRGINYQTALRFLQGELFLSERTIADILMDNQDILRHLVSSNTELKTLRTKFPFMNWSPTLN